MKIESLEMELGQLTTRLEVPVQQVGPFVAVVEPKQNGAKIGRTGNRVQDKSQFQKAITRKKAP